MDGGTEEATVTVLVTGGMDAGTVTSTVGGDGVAVVVVSGEELEGDEQAATSRIVTAGEIRGGMRRTLLGPPGWRGSTPNMAGCRCLG